MPRIAAKKNEYKKKDFSKWLIGKMWELGLKQSDVAGWLNISQQALSQKLRNSSFTLSDLLEIFSRIQTDEGEIEKLLK